MIKRDNYLLNIVKRNKEKKEMRECEVMRDRQRKTERESARKFRQTQKMGLKNFF